MGEDEDWADDELTDFGQLVRRVAARVEATDRTAFVHFDSDQVDGTLSEVVRAVLAETGRGTYEPVFTGVFHRTD